MTTKLHILYIILLIVVGGGIYLATSVSFEDEGGCRYNATDDQYYVRQPNSDVWDLREFCIIIK